MRVEREWLRRIVFGRDGTHRFTQDSPILPEVWLVGGLRFCAEPEQRIDLLLTPHRAHTPAALAEELQYRLEATDPAPRGAEDEGGNAQLITRPVWTLAVSQSTVAVSLTFKELVTAALPLTPWWFRNRIEPETQTGTRAERLKQLKNEPPPKRESSGTPIDQRKTTSEEVRWMRRVVGVIALCAERSSTHSSPTDPQSERWLNSPQYDLDDLDEESDEGPLKLDPSRNRPRASVADFNEFRLCANNQEGQVEIFRNLEREAWRLAAEAAERRDELRIRRLEDDPPLLWSISLNRRARPAIKHSVSSTKADAARRLFKVSCKDLTWAIVDTGIDATHAAFKQPPAVPPEKNAIAKVPAVVQGERVTKTYDFTRLRLWTTLDSHPSTGPSVLHQSHDLEESDRRFKRLRQRLRSGQPLDWALLEPLIRVSHEEANYEKPRHDHGTHVAGILGGTETDAKEGEGMCPDINLIDLRVLDQDGKGDEFSIIAALQFIRYLNATSDEPVIHGVNLSLSLLHDVENYACGRTPICEECERLVASGVVVVAAAGNRGFERVLTGAGELDAYRSISITDPGNAEAVITVGATHRFQPHTYGVSYFSSRGPTGDGRIKPDVLAPGERIYSCVFDQGYDAKDGTSMAAPHVSGVAALVMARHREFVGQPERIKRILMKTATDLGRERYFQGAGMVDALRALQSV